MDRPRNLVVGRAGGPGRKVVFTRGQFSKVRHFGLSLFSAWKIGKEQRSWWDSEKQGKFWEIPGNQKTKRIPARICLGIPPLRNNWRTCYWQKLQRRIPIFAAKLKGWWENECCVKMEECSSVRFSSAREPTFNGATCGASLNPGRRHWNPRRRH